MGTEASAAAAAPGETVGTEASVVAAAVRPCCPKVVAGALEVLLEFVRGEPDDATIISFGFYAYAVLRMMLESRGIHL